MKKIKLTKRQLKSLSVILDYLMDPESVITDIIEQDCKDWSAFDIIQDLRDIYNNSLD